MNEQLMFLDEALEAADQMLDPDDGGVEELMDSGLDVMSALVAELRRLRTEHAAALEIARREGAEEVRERILDVVPYITEHDKAIIAALPLDAPAAPGGER